MFLINRARPCPNQEKPWNSTWVQHTGGQGSENLSHHLLLPRVSISRKRGLGLKLGLEPRHSEMGHRGLKQLLNSWASQTPPQDYFVKSVTYYNVPIRRNTFISSNLSLLYGENKIFSSSLKKSTYYHYLQLP